MRTDASAHAARIKDPLAWFEGKKKWKRDFVRENQKDIRALLAETDAEGDG